MDDMKKTLVVSLGALMLLSSCGTYAGAGAVTGGSFGSIIGSAIGGISGGWRGSNVGSLIGMAGGAVVGAAIGSAADRAEQQRYEEYAEQRRQRRYEDYVRTRASERRTPQYGQNSEQRGYDGQGDYNNDQSGFDGSNSGDDRLFGFDENFNAKPDSVSVTALSLPAIEIRNAHIIDATHDGMLSRGEEIRMVFEVYNNSSVPVLQIQPTVSEITGNKHIHISENVLVESIMPGRGIRYTAVIKADNRLKDGEAIIRISVLHQNKEVASQTKEFPIHTSR